MNKIHESALIDGEENIDLKFYECVKDLIEHEDVLKMKEFKQHCDINCFQHCINVAYYSYKICKACRLDYKSAARGALLHDMFLYDWRITKLEKGKHAFRHPAIALENAEKTFMLNSVEKDIIKKHMWPLTVVPPKYGEAFIISCVDKYCAVKEIAHHYKKNKKDRVYR